MYLVLFVVLLLCSVYTAGSNLTLTFTYNSNVEIGQSAFYHCSVNDDGEAALFQVNGTVVPDVVPKNSGIKMSGSGSSKNLTIPGRPQYNNTVVRCTSTNSSLGYNESTLTIQGLLAAVTNLSCRQNCSCDIFGQSPTESGFTLIDSSGPVTPFIDKSNCVQCRWGEPFSFTPIYRYMYNATNKDSVNNNITDAYYEYCPSQYGQHNFSVAASNTVGQGNITKKTLNIPTCNTLHLEAMNGEWAVKFVLNASCLNRSLNYNVLLYLNDEKEIRRNGSGNFDDDKFVGTVHVGAVRKSRWNVSVSLSTYMYLTELIINTSGNISTFGIFNVNVKFQDGRICFTAEFVKGMDTQYSLVTYECISTNFSGRLLISKDKGKECTTGVEPNNYTITFYDGKHNLTKYMYKKLNDVHVPTTSPPSTMRTPSSSVDEEAIAVTLVILLACMAISLW